MPDAMPSTENAALAQAFRAGDENALTTFYGREYEALLALAGRELGPDLDHFRARIAQSAMLVVWGNHARYETLDGVQAAAEEAIREQAAVQRRKHAALHHSAGSSSRPHVTVPSAEVAVEELRQALHVQPVDHAQAAEEAAALRKHHAAERVQKVSKGRGWVRPTILVVVFGAAIFAVTQWVNRSGAEIAATSAIEAENARVLSSGRGQRGTVSLFDGTSVKIGAETEVRAPADFGVAVRTLRLTGAASFDVAPGKPLPFVVRAGPAVITAIGTRLTVRAYADDPDAYVSVDEGAAEVRAKDGGPVTPLAAGQALRLAADGTVTMLDDAQRAVANSWLTDSLVFVDQPLRVVLPELIRWVGITASLADSSLGARSVSARFGLQSKGEALTVLTEAAKLSVGFDAEDKIVLSDAPPEKGKRVR